MFTTRRISSLIWTILIAAFCHANDMPPQGKGRSMRVPPPEAYDVCEGKQAGDKVSFTTPRGDKVSGVCTMLPARLAAMPDRPDQGGNPPPKMN